MPGLGVAVGGLKVESLGVRVWGMGVRVWGVGLRLGFILQLTGSPKSESSVSRERKVLSSRGCSGDDYVKNGFEADHFCCLWSSARMGGKGIARWVGETRTRMEHIICWRFLAAAARESAKGTRRPCRTDPPVVFIPATLGDHTGVSGRTSEVCRHHSSDPRQKFLN